MKGLGCLKQLNVEPLLFLTVTGNFMMSLTRQSFYFERVCVDHQSLSVCQSDLNATAKIDVERRTTNFIQAYTVVEAVVPFVLSLFIGPWEDENGRKLPMMAAVTGMALSAATYTVLTFLSLPTWCLLAASVPYALGGQMPVLLLSAFSYLSDTVHASRKTARFAVAECCAVVGAPVGLLLSSRLMTVGGFPLVFAAATAFVTAALVYAVIKVDNRVPPHLDGEEQTLLGRDVAKSSSMTVAQQFRSIARACLKKRENGARSMILMIMVIMALGEFCFYSEEVIGFMYAKHKFDWTAQQYGSFRAICIAAMAVGVLFGVVVMRYLGFSDALMTLIGCLSRTAYLLLVGLAKSGTMAWWAVPAGALGMVPSTVGRAMISKLVAGDEVGKMYSLIAVCQALMPLLAAPLASHVFKSWVSVDAGAVYYCLAAMNAVALSICIIMYCIIRKYGRVLTREAY